MLERYCAHCGKWRSMFSTVRDPRRSLCQTCYGDLAVRHKFGKDYQGPHVTPPHKNVEMWFTQPWGKEWVRVGAREAIRLAKARAFQESQRRGIQRARAS